MSEANQEEKIVATLVDDEAERMEFMPRHLGNQLFRGMNKPFEWADRLSKDYGGGMWQFFNLSNGGWYTAPAGDKKYNVQQNMNGYEGEMSADAFGITCTIFTLAELMQNGDEKLIAQYWALLDFVAEHAESSAIFAAID